MISVARNLYDYRELVATLAWKNIAQRYKQAALGLAWAVIKPVTLMLIFTLVRSFVGIDSGSVPYPVLTFAALMPWISFAEPFRRLHFVLRDSTASSVRMAKEILRRCNPALRFIMQLRWASTSSSWPP